MRMILFLCLFCNCTFNASIYSLLVLHPFLYIYSHYLCKVTLNAQKNANECLKSAEGWSLCSAREVPTASFIPSAETLQHPDSTVILTRVTS